MGQEWGEAAGNLEMRPTEAAFSGGTVQKNEPLRKAILRGIGLQNDTGDYDIIQGMLQLTKLLERE